MSNTKASLAVVVTFILMILTMIIGVHFGIPGFQHSL